MAINFPEWTGLAREAETGSTQPPMTAPSRAAAPRSVNVGEALGLPAVWRAVHILAIAGKQLSIDTYRYGIQVDDHPLTRLPDPNLSRSSWIEQVVVSLACTGNAYLELKRDPDDTIRAIPVLNPLDVRIKSDSFGTVTGYGYRGRDLPASRIKHLTLLRVPGTAYGLGPIQAAQPDLRGALDTRDYAANWFQDGGQPNGILSTDQPLPPQTTKAVKDTWNESAGAKNGVAVLSNGLKYQPIFMSPKDVQFIEAQQFNVTAIARMFGIPASLMLTAVDGGTSQTYSNVEQEWLAFLRFTLMGYLVEIEDALSDLLPGKQRARFNVEALLRADTTTRYGSYETAIRAGFLDVDEVRALENRAPKGTPNV